MKQTITYLLLLFLFLNGNAQENNGFGFFTDRDVYVGGELVMAKIFTPENNSSKVVYLDLVNQAGVRITGVTLEIRNFQAEGFLQLPDSLSTSTYLLRGYLKNTSGKYKIIREIWVTNRFTGLEKTNQVNRVSVQNFIPEEQKSQIQISGITPEYRTNEKINAQIEIGDELLKNIDGDLLVAVAQTNKDFHPASFLWNSVQPEEKLTENKGMILSGIVTDKKSQNPASGVTVFLTIPDSVPGFQYYKTNSDGRYYFLLDKYYGPVQAIIQCWSTDPAQRLKITLDDQSFDAANIPGFYPEPVPAEFKSGITGTIDVVTFQKVFGQEKLLARTTPKRKPDSYPYYGKSTVTVDPQLFIDLPNFNEISKELLSGVKFRNYNNEPKMQVYNSGLRNFFDEKPLILIDGIPISDLNVIKDMGTTDIDRIDVCMNERYYGDLRFPGVVAIYSTKGDYSKIVESDQLIRLKAETMQPHAKIAIPVITETNIPDLRQLLFWNPSTSPNKSISVSCTTSSIAGTFKFVVRGRLNDGTFFFSEKQFEVK
ncbi:MAG: hypothetical protein WAO52_05190 [Prolixibacteraceae bacterium]